MVIPPHSRYADERVQVETVAGRDGQPTKIIAAPIWYGTDFSALRYTVGEGERLDQIAYTHYRDPEMWWVIAVANPELLYPDRIPGGTEIRIPLASSLR